MWCAVDNHNNMIRICAKGFLDLNFKDGYAHSNMYIFHF